MLTATQFCDLHIASTGTAGTIRAYYDQLSTPYVPPNETAGTPAKAGPPAAAGLNSWNEAQRAHLNSSHRLADLIQIMLAQRFSGSPLTPLGAAVRDLRSVAGPAVAIELSSVSAPDPVALANSAVAPLGEAIAGAVNSFRAATPGGAKQ